MRTNVPLLVRYELLFFSTKRRTQIAEKICGKKPACLPGEILVSIRRNDGFVYLLIAELILFGWCLIGCLFLDLFCASSGPLWMISGFLACLVCFFLREENRVRTALKALFLFYSLCFGSLLSVTVIFLIAFEHIAAGGDFERKEPDE